MPASVARPGSPLVTDSRYPGEVCSPRRAQPCGTTSALGSGVPAGGHHHLPTSLRSTVVTRFRATTDALTPTGPCVVASRGSLIHGSLTSHHAVSNHRRCSAGRVPLPQRRQHYFVRGSRRLPSRLARTADRIEFTLWRYDRQGVTAWSFSSRGSPPGGIAPRQFRLDTGLRACI